MAAAAENGKPSTTAKRSAEEDEPAMSHHKYCHFCQHVKIRSSSMLGCQNQSCMRRFCRHCLLTHLGEEDETAENDNTSPPWYCPICRNKCCCAKTECTESHRHCKAYRYRCSRAEKSIKRASGASKKKRTLCPKRAPLAPGSSGSEMGAPGLAGDESSSLHSYGSQVVWHDLLRGDPGDEHRILRPGDEHRFLRPGDESSPPPLTVYESGAEHHDFQLMQGNYHLDLDDEGEGGDERVADQLLGRMHSKQPHWLSDAVDSNDMEWLRQSYLVVYQHPAPNASDAHLGHA